MPNLNPIVPSRKLGDADYRWYNCNLQAPKIKCSELVTNTLTIANVGIGGPTSTSGYRGMSSTHIFTGSDIPSLAKSQSAGELTLYAINTSASCSSVVMSGITRVAGAYPDGGTLIFQRIGNFTDITVSTGTGVTFSFTPACEVRWVYRGF